MRKALKDFEGALVKGSQKRMSRGREDENVGGIEKVRRKLKGRRMGMRRRKRARKSVMEARKELGGIILRKKGKLGGKN
jgi:hypothetical protein